MASGEEKGCVLWTLMSIGLLVAAVVALCALAGCDHPKPPPTVSVPSLVPVISPFVLPSVVAAPPSPDGIKCRDGSISYAKTRKGACSQHGGIA